MIKKVLTIASILALTACGGGGGNDNNTPNQPDNGNGNGNNSNTAPVISSLYNSIYMDENSLLSIPLNLTNAENETLLFEIDTTAEINANVNASVNASNNLIINTGEISEDVQTFITVIVTDEGNLRDDVKFNLNIKNVVQETDQITIEVNPSLITLQSPTFSDSYPNNLNKNIFYNVISKDTNNNITVSFNKQKSTITDIENPYFRINPSTESVGYTLTVLPHESFQNDIVDQGYETTTFTITASNGINQDTKTITVKLEPLTKESVEGRLEALIEELNSLSSFSTEEELAVLEYLIEYLENTETITFKEKQNLLAEITQLISSIALNSASGELTIYRTGGFENGFARLGIETILQISQAGGFENLETLLNSLSAIDLEDIERRILLIKQERYEEHAAYFEDYIETLDNRYDLNFPEMDMSNRFESEQGLSVFIGNGDFGYLNGTEWKAFKRYSFIEGILAKLYNTTEFNISSGETSSEEGEE